MIRLSAFILGLVFTFNVNAQNDIPRKVESAFKKENKDIDAVSWLSFEKNQKYLAIFGTESNSKISALNADGDILFVGNIVSPDKVSNDMQQFLKERFVGASLHESVKYSLEQTFQLSLENQPLEAAMLKFKDTSKYLVLYFDTTGKLVKREILE